MIRINKIYRLLSTILISQIVLYPITNIFNSRAESATVKSNTSVRERVETVRKQSLGYGWDLDYVKGKVLPQSRRFDWGNWSNWNNWSNW